MQADGADDREPLLRQVGAPQWLVGCARGGFFRVFLGVGTVGTRFLSGFKETPQGTPLFFCGGQLCIGQTAFLCFSQESLCTLMLVAEQAISMGCAALKAKFGQIGGT